MKIRDKVERDTCPFGTITENVPVCPILFLGTKSRNVPRMSLGTGTGTKYIYIYIIVCPSGHGGTEEQGL
jgi:hypothetical protein